MCDFLLQDMRGGIHTACLLSANTSFPWSVSKDLVTAHSVPSTDGSHLFVFASREQQCIKQTKALS